MLRIGLTGGIACGKSVVLRRLAARGIATLDLDDIARDVMAPGGTAHEDVVAAFGAGILATDGSIDREALGGVVFGDGGARQRLEMLVHPRVREEEAARAARLAGAGHTILVSDAALLVEAGAHLRFDRLVIVHCPPEVQEKRLVARDAMSPAQARARIEAQMPIGEKRRYAHIEVDSSGSVAETEEAADLLATELIGLVDRPQPCAVMPAHRTLGALVHGASPGPRGLTGRALLESAVRQGGLEMALLARELWPPVRGPWFRVARGGEAEPWPEALAVPLVVWALACSADRDWLLCASSSLARLTHVEPEVVAGAALAGMAALEVAASGSVRSIDERSVQWKSQARRWGGEAPSPRVRRALDAAAACPDDPSSARRWAEASGGEPALAGALVGMAVGEPLSDADPDLIGLVKRLS